MCMAALCQTHNAGWCASVTSAASPAATASVTGMSRPQKPQAVVRPSYRAGSNFCVNSRHSLSVTVACRGKKETTRTVSSSCALSLITYKVLMKFSLLLAALIATLGLAACEKTVVTPPVAAPVVVVPGPAGPAGATGATGATGSTGSTVAVPGPTGATGATGAPGYDGATGSTGSTGATGASGATGYDGAKGDTGADGKKGDTLVVIPAK